MFFAGGRGGRGGQLGSAAILFRRTTNLVVCMPCSKMVFSSLTELGQDLIDAEQPEQQPANHRNDGQRLAAKARSGTKEGRRHTGGRDKVREETGGGEGRTGRSDKQDECVHFSYVGGDKKQAACTYTSKYT